MKFMFSLMQKKGIVAAKDVHFRMNNIIHSSCMDTHIFLTKLNFSVLGA